MRRTHLLVIFAAITAPSVHPTADDAPVACIVSSGERSFDLSELGTHLRHTSEEPDSRGWAYSFSACGDVPPRSVGADCRAVLPAAVLQETKGACYSLGASSTRTVSALARGVALSFGGGSSCGETPRSTTISIECADVPLPEVVRWSHGATLCSYAGVVRARAGCAVACERDASGAVCSGAANGVCVAEEGGEGPARCECAKGRAGAACADRIRVLPTDSPQVANGNIIGIAGSLRGSALTAAFVLAALLSAAFAAGLPHASRDGKLCGRLGGRQSATASPTSWRAGTILCVLPLVLLAVAFRAASEAISSPPNTGMLRLQQTAECAALKSAAFVIVSYQPSSRPPLPIFERGLRNMARFWPFPNNDVDIYIADNNVGDSGSSALLRNASLKAFGDAEALKIVPNKGLGEGFRYVYGGLRAVILRERWHSCFPYHYLVIYTSATALLSKVQFDLPERDGSYRNNFRPFMTYSNAGYDWGSALGRWSVRQVEAAGVPLNQSGRSALEATGVFGNSFVMSRSCLETWLKRGIIINFPRSEVKLHDQCIEALSGILATSLCGWTGASFDGPLERYIADCRGAGEGCVNMSEAALKGRTIMKVWGTA